jgi:type IV secretion system protein VirD4
MENFSRRSSYARWASDDEVKSSLYKVSFKNYKPRYGGIPLYADDSAVYVEDKDSHSLIIGSTGSKKTRLIGMPALRMYAMAGESFIATDPKAELYKKTYHLLKKQDYRIFILNLRDPRRSHAWNPLRIPYLHYRNGEKDRAIELVIDMASCIANNENHKDPYWENSAADMLAGLILLLFEYADENEINFRSLRTLRKQAFKIVEFNNGKFKKNEKYVPYIQNNFLEHLDKIPFLPFLLSGTAEAPDDTRSSIISVFDQAMRLFFCQDNLMDMLSGNDFDISGIGKTKTAVFLITPDENTVYNKLISVFVKQCYTELLREAEKNPNNRLPIRVNFLLDEFSNLPTITDFPAMISASRSRNIRFNLFIQSQNQLVERYGYHAETIKGNCENWVFLHSRELPLLNEIVGLSGMKNACLPLVSVSMLQTLDKDKGEVFILNKRLYPYIANLLDIDEYPNMAQEEQTVQYPENTCKTNAVFDFKHHCENNIRQINMVNDDVESPFSSNIPFDDEFLEMFNEGKKSEIVSETQPPIDIYAEGVGRGWNGLIMPILDEIKIYNERHPEKEITIEVIKEKYGILCFSTLKSPNYIRGMISIAEKESGHICEFCGVEGKLVEIDGWLKTLCEHHIKAKKESNQDRKLEKKLYRKAIEKLIKE